jgi:hypothetical protein
MLISRTLAVATLILAQVCSAQPTNIVDNGDFQDGLSLWNTSNYGGGNHTLEVLESYDGYKDVLHLKRTSSHADGGGETLTQTFSTPPRECIAKWARISGRFKIVSHSLGNSGWYAKTYGGLGEYPLAVLLYTGGQLIWNRGLLTEDNIMKHTNYDQIPLNEWVEDSWLVKLDSYSLTSIAIHSRGWDFDVYVDYIKVETAE